MRQQRVPQINDKVASLKTTPSPNQIYSPVKIINYKRSGRACRVSSQGGGFPARLRLLVAYAVSMSPITSATRFVQAQARRAAGLRVEVSLGLVVLVAIIVVGLSP